MIPTENLYWYKAKVADADDVSKYTRPVVDGDTVYLWLDLGLYTWNMQSCRLHGIDTPERGEPGFDAATDELFTILYDADELVVQSNSLGKYGRPIVTIHALINGDWLNVNQHMLDEGLAKPYGE